LRKKNQNEIRTRQNDQNAERGMVQTRVTLRPGMPCRKMLPVIGLLPKFAEPSVTLLPSELTLALNDSLGLK
jgi:hypothetical protein